MTRKTFAAAACLFVLWFLPQTAVAQLPPPPPPPLGGPPPPPPLGGKPVPAPELDVGLLSFIMVGAAASLAYWRKRNS
jgi:hypothetical protein